MAYGEFYVEHQGWARWPKTLIMCRKRGYEIIERRRYIPERTCKPVEKDGVMRCADCDYPLGIMSVPAYCAGCGAKVVSE